MSSNENKNNSSDLEDRREYFRVSHQGLVEVKPSSQELTEVSVLNAIFPDPTGGGLLQELQNIDQSNSHLLNSIAGRNGYVASYLKGINKKIELLAHHLTRPTQEELIKHQSHIDFSEGGLAFSSHHHFDNSDYLALKVTFLPNFSILKVFVRVEDCQWYEDKKYYRVATSFYHLSDHQRQIVAQQVIKVQQAQRRSKTD